MYHYALIIQLYTQSPVLEKVLRALPAFDGFTHQIDFQPTASERKPGSLTISVFDTDSLRADPPALLGKKEPTDYWILCAEPTQLALIPHQLLNSLDDFCPLPLTEAGAYFCFSRLLRQIKLEKDHALTQTYLDTAIDSIPDLIWFKDIRGAHLKVNKGFCHAVGKTKEQIQGRGHYYIWDLTEEEYTKGEYVCLDTEETVLKERKTCLFDEMVKTKDDMLRLKTYKSPIFDEFGSVVGTVGIAQDVTELKNTHTEQEIIFQNIPFALLLHDTDGKVTNINRRFRDYFQVTPAKLIHSNYQQWAEKTFSSITKSNKTGYLEAVYNQNGQQRILQIHQETIVDTFDVTARYLWIYQDITMERHFEEETLFAANKDYLTGLNNRRSLYDFASIHEGVDAISLFSLDLDNFKRVNDTYGHEAGDNALSLTANVMRESFPEQFVSRLGGDEFLIAFLNEPDASSLSASAEKLLLKIRNSFSACEQFKGMSVSIGVMFNTDKNLSFDELIKRADAALYQAKQDGRNQTCLWIP